MVKLPALGPTSQNAFVSHHKAPPVIVLCMENLVSVHYIVSLGDHCQSHLHIKVRTVARLVHPCCQEMRNFLHFFAHLRSFASGVS